MVFKNFNNLRNVYSKPLFVKYLNKIKQYFMIIHLIFSFDIHLIFYFLYIR